MLNASILVCLSFLLQTLSAQLNRGSIEKFHVSTTIRLRYARTKIVCVVANKEKRAVEIEYAYIIPRTALLTNYTISVSDTELTSVISKKRKRKSKGNTSSTSSNQRIQYEEDVYSLPLHMSPGAKIVHTIIYEEALTRHQGLYEYTVNLQPTMVVRDIQIDIRITEPSKLRNVTKPRFRRDEFEEASDVDYSDYTTIPYSSAHKIHYRVKPGIAQQGPNGYNGVLQVFYDVDLNDNFGEVYVNKGYLVSIFAPKDLTLCSKDVVFVIDCSESMSGGKLDQVKKAFIAIINDLDERDKFNIVKFGSNVNDLRKRELLLATPKNKARAVAFIESIVAFGGTNLNVALERAMNMLNKAEESNGKMVILLTDGHPSVGEINFKKILLNTQKAAKGKVSLHCFGLGDYMSAYMKFLKRLALENNGYAYKIPLNLYAIDNISELYKSVARPVLFDIHVLYPEHLFSSISENYFNTYFDGSQIVVVGKLKKEYIDKDISIPANFASTKENANLNFNFTVKQDNLPPVMLKSLSDGELLLDRIWGFYMIKYALLKKLSTKEYSERMKYRELAANISVDYGFASEVTRVDFMFKNEVETFLEEQKLKDEIENQIDEGDHPKPQRDSNVSVPNQADEGADGDPHFIVALKEGHICFDINIKGRITLINDSQSGIVAEATLLPLNKVSNSSVTFINSINITFGSKFFLTISSKGIFINSLGHFRWNCKHWQKFRKFRKFRIFKNFYVIIAHKTVFIKCDGHDSIAVMRHSSKIDSIRWHYFGFYTINSALFTPSPFGILNRDTWQNLNIVPIDNLGNGTAVYNNNTIKFHRKVVTNRFTRETINCWFMEDFSRKMLHNII